MEIIKKKKREMEIKRKNSVREMEIKINDARICLIKMVERIRSVDSQKWKSSARVRESEAENNEWMHERKNEEIFCLRRETR